MLYKFTQSQILRLSLSSRRNQLQKVIFFISSNNNPGRSVRTGCGRKMEAGIRWSYPVTDFSRFRRTNYNRPAESSIWETVIVDLVPREA
jgi:hypothetical protein